MVKGVSIKFKTYSESVGALLNLIKLSAELQNHDTIIVKPYLKNLSSKNSEPALVESVLKYCLMNKREGAQVFIAEGSDGEDTNRMFEVSGYKKLAEHYNIGLIDLNTSEVEEIQDGEFIKFDKIYFPQILKNSFVITLSPASEDAETEITGSLATMLGAFPSRHYKGFFSSSKSKIRKWPIKYSIHDILRCKMPNLAIVDAADKGLLMAGQPMEIDKQLCKLLGKDWKSVGYTRLVDESFSAKKENALPDNLEAEQN
jgi:uncharacterized protein (DUF362 family)